MPPNYESKPVSLSLSLNLNPNPITKQILILTRLLSELRESITPPNYHCDHGLDSGILQLDYMYLPSYVNDWVCPVGVREDIAATLTPTDETNFPSDRVRAKG